jgi:hypothetical protein
MTKQGVRFNCKDNENLTLIKAMIAEGVKVFIDALPGVEEKMSYKAFNLSSLTSSPHLDAFMDIVMTELAIQIDEKAPKEGFTYKTSFDEGIVWLHATKGIEEEPVLAEASGIGHLPPEKHLVAKDVLYSS